MVDRSEQVTGMVTDDMIRDTLIAFRDLMDTLYKNYDDVIPLQIITLKTPELRNIHGLFTMFKAAREKTRSGKTYLEAALEQIKKQEQRSSLLRNIDDWKDQANIGIFSIEEINGNLASVSNLKTQQNETVIIPADLKFDGWDNLFAFVIPCGPYKLIVSAPFHVSNEELQFLLKAIDEAMKEVGAEIDSVWDLVERDADFIFIMLDHIGNFSFPNIKDFKRSEESTQVDPVIAEAVKAIDELDDKVEEDHGFEMVDVLLSMYEQSDLVANKPEPLVAAFEYVFRKDIYPNDYKKITIKHLSEKYGTSAASISNRKNQIVEYLRSGEVPGYEYYG